MNTVIAGSNHLVVNYYSAYLEMLELENEQYSSIPVGLKRANMQKDVINIFVIIETREDFLAFSKLKGEIDSNSKNLILICMTEELVKIATTPKLVVFNHKNLTNDFSSALAKMSICKPYLQNGASETSPEKVLEHIKFMLLKGKINLPVKNECAISVLSALDNDNITFKAIDEMTKTDPVLHSGIIKMANSAYFSGAFSSVSDVEKALVRVGLSNVKVYLINFINKSLASNADLLFHQEIVEKVEDSLKVGCLCYVMADLFKVTSPVSMFSVGLMSLLGEIFMYAAISDYLSGQEFPDGKPTEYSEITKSNGMKVGGMLLKKWKMAEDYYMPVLYGKNLEQNSFMNETRILFLALNMLNLYDTGQVNDTLLAALNKTQISLEESHLSKIRVDAMEHYKKLYSVLS